MPRAGSIRAGTLASSADAPPGGSRFRARRRAVRRARHRRRDHRRRGGARRGLGGYSVALVERSDSSIGTSSRSTKLVHGGLRYLQNFDLGLVREALLERQFNVALAPHLVRPLPLIVPAFDGARPDRLIGSG